MNRLTNFRVIVEYKDKKNSSARVVGDAVLLSISSRLSPRERQIHKEKLLSRVASRFQLVDASLGQAQEGAIRTDEDLEKLAAGINQRYFGFAYERIRFFTQNSQWGSCNPRTGILHISHRLKGAPLELVEYVVIHELCHLREANHSSRFWDLVAGACPDYQVCRKALTTYGLQMTKTKEL